MPTVLRMLAWVNSFLHAAWHQAQHLLLPCPQHVSQVSAVLAAASFMADMPHAWRRDHHSLLPCWQHPKCLLISHTAHAAGRQAQHLLLPAWQQQCENCVERAAAHGSKGRQAREAGDCSAQ